MCRGRGTAHHRAAQVGVRLRSHLHLLFKAYLLFVFCFVLTTLLFDSWQSSDSLALRVAAWSLWGFSLAYTLLLTKREIHQVYCVPTVRLDTACTLR